MYHTWDSLPHPTWNGNDAWWQPTDYVTTKGNIGKSGVGVSNITNRKVPVISYK